MEQTKINPDLINERRSCTFNTLELTHLLDGGREKTTERKWRGIYYIFLVNEITLKFRKLFFE